MGKLIHWTILKMRKELLQTLLFSHITAEFPATFSTFSEKTSLRIHLSLINNMKICKYNCYFTDCIYHHKNISYQCHNYALYFCHCSLNNKTWKTNLKDSYIPPNSLTHLTLIHSSNQCQNQFVNQKLICQNQCC